MALNREQIEQQPTRTHAELEIPEWGDSVLLQSLTAAEREAYEMQFSDKEGNLRDVSNIQARLVVKGLVDPETYDRMFSDKEHTVVGEWDGRVVRRMFNKVRELSGMDDQAVEEAEGNSEAGPGDGSSSA